MKPASVLLESTPEPAPKAVPPPVFLVDLPAWHTVFFRNLFDLFGFGQQPPLGPSSLPGAFCAVSVLGHVAAIAAILGSVQFWPQEPEVVVKSAFSRADVIYYAPSEYLPPLDTGGTRKPLPQKGEPEYAAQPIISVPPEADNRTQTIVTPSDVKLNHDVPLPNIVAWSQTPAQPSVPLASTTAAAANLRLPTLSVSVVAPAPEAIPADRQRGPSLSQAVVAPAPEVHRSLRSGCSGARIARGGTIRRSFGGDRQGASRDWRCWPSDRTAAALDRRQSWFEPRWKAHLARDPPRSSGAGGNANWKSPRHFCRDSGRQGRRSGHS